MSKFNRTEVVQQAVTEFGQQFKVDWTIPERQGTQLRTIWEISLINPNPRLISAFIKWSTMKDIKLLDTVAILNSVPRERLTLVELDYEAVPSLPSGQVGTVVEVYEKGALRFVLCNGRRL